MNKNNTMQVANIFKDILQPLIILLGFIIALFQYQRQQKFKRLQNLSVLWKNFSDKDDLLTLFDLMNEIESGNSNLANELNDYDRKIKLKYLALIEEVSLYAGEFEVDKDYAKYLFQWHFYFPYQSSFTSVPFWSNIGGKEEMNASYWEKSRHFSGECKPV